MYVPRHPPPMPHLLTSWRPAWKSVAIPHMGVSQEVGCQIRMNPATSDRLSTKTGTANRWLRNERLVWTGLNRRRRRNERLPTYLFAGPLQRRRVTVDFEDIGADFLCYVCGAVAGGGGLVGRSRCPGPPVAVPPEPRALPRVVPVLRARGPVSSSRTHPGLIVNTVRVVVD